VSGIRHRGALSSAPWLRDAGARPWRYRLRAPARGTPGTGPYRTNRGAAAPTDPTLLPDPERRRAATMRPTCRPNMTALPSYVSTLMDCSCTTTSTGYATLRPTSTPTVTAPSLSCCRARVL